MANTFKIIFDGDILPGHDIAKVKQEVASFFNTDGSGVNAYFNGGNVFVKDHLDFVTANKYRSAFAKAGADCRIMPMTECPACGHRQEKTKKCINCDFDKDSSRAVIKKKFIAGKDFLSKIIKDDAVPEVPGTKPDIDYSREAVKNKAVSGIRLGVILLVVAFFIDYLAQKAYSDLLFLYLFCIPPIVYGCVYYAKLKGYSGWLGIIGLTILFGVSILLLVPDRTVPREQRRLSWTEKLAGILVISVSLFWAGQQVVKYNVLNEYIQMRTNYEESLAEYEVPPLESAARGMRDFMDKGFQILELYQDDLRPRSHYEITKMIIEEHERLLYILQYKYFLRYSRNKTAEPLYASEDILQLKREIFHYLQKKVTALNDNRVASYYSNIILLIYNIGDIHWSINFEEATNNFTGSLQRVSSFLSYYLESEKKLPGSVEDLVSYAREKRFNRADSVKETFSVESESPGEILLTVKKGYFAGETVAYGVVPIQNRRHGKKISGFKLLRIGGTLPDCYRKNDSDLYIDRIPWNEEKKTLVWLEQGKDRKWKNIFGE